VKGLFITGTDTGVGKTFVACALARAARAAGHRVFAFKPIETGCELRAGELVGSDQSLLVEAAGGWQQGVLRGTYQFRKPASPLVAARAEGRCIDLAAIKSDLKSGMAQADHVLVEGAGGWRVPVIEAVDMGVVARLVGFPVLVVARAGLGTINHTLLTAEAITRDGLQLAGVVVSRKPEDGEAEAESNASEIRARVDCVVNVWPDLQNLW